MAKKGRANLLARAVVQGLMGLFLMMEH